MVEGAELKRFLPRLKRKDLRTLRVFAKGVVAWGRSGGEVAFYHGVGVARPPNHQYGEYELHFVL